MWNKYSPNVPKKCPRSCIMGAQQLPDLKCACNTNTLSNELKPNRNDHVVEIRRSFYPDRCDCTQARSLRDPTQTAPCVPQWVCWRSNGHQGCRGFQHTRPALKKEKKNYGKGKVATLIKKTKMRKLPANTCRMSSSSMRSVQFMRSTFVSEPLYSMTVPLKVISLLNMATTKFPFRRELDWLSDNAGIRNG